MSFKKPSLEPFEKAFPQRNSDEWLGRDNKSYKNDTEFVQPFNRNSSRNSPTTSSDSFKPIDTNKYLKMPFKE